MLNMMLVLGSKRRSTDYLAENTATFESVCENCDPVLGGLYPLIQAKIRLPAERGFDLERCKKLIGRIFEFWRTEGGGRNLKSLPPPPRSATALKPPPETWCPAYERFASELRLESDMGKAFALVRGRLEEMLG